MTELVILIGFIVGIIVGIIIKLPILSMHYDNIKAIQKEIEEKETLCTDALIQIQSDWAENWDLFIDFFGQEAADSIDKAISYESNKKS